MWSSGQLPQGFPVSHRCGGGGGISFTVRELSFLKSMQKRSDPSFFLTKTTALHHGLLLGRITPASSISFRCSLTSSNCGGGILRNRSLNGGVSGSLRTILCSAALGVAPCLVSQGKRYRGPPSGGREPFLPALSATHLGRTSPTCPGASPDAPPPLRWRRGLVPWLRRQLMTRGTKFAATILAIGVPFLISSQSLVLFLNTTGTLLLPVAKVA